MTRDRYCTPSLTLLTVFTEYVLARLGLLRVFELLTFNSQEELILELSLPPCTELHMRGFCPFIIRLDKTSEVKRRRMGYHRRDILVSNNYLINPSKTHAISGTIVIPDNGRGRQESATFGCESNFTVISSHLVVLLYY